MHILFVDDETSLLDQAKIFIEKLDEDLKIEPVSSAEEGLKELSREEYDAVVSDYQMPCMNGLEFLEKVREERDNDIPFIIFTGKGREEVAMKALNLGADRYMQKGGDPRDQYEVLAQAIKQEVEHRVAESLLKLTKYSVDNASLEIFWITPEGEFTYANETAAERLGYSKEGLEGMRVWDIDPNHGKDKRKERWKKLKDEGVLVFESEHETKEGKRYPVEITSHHLEFGGKEYEFAFVEDIGERKERENKLKKNKDWLSQIVEGSSVPLFVIDEDHKVTHWNKACENLTGISKDDLVGTEDPWKAFYDEARPVLADLVLDDASEEEIERWYGDDLSRLSILDGAYETRDYFPDMGEEGKWVFFTAAPLTDSDGDTIGAIETLQDVTKREEQRQELKQKEQILDHTPAYINVIDEEGNIEYHSYPSDEITGLNPNKFMGSEAMDFAHPDDREDAMEMFSKVLENPGEEYSTELRGEVEDGWIWLEVRAVNHLDDPTINGIIVSAQDISDRKEMEEELKESEKKFGIVIENSADAIFLTDQEGNYTYVNQAASDLLGYSREELTEMNILDLTRKEDAEEYMKVFEEILEEGKIFTEMSIVKKDGTEVPVDLNAILLPNGLVYGSCRDITKRKEAEEKLKKQEEKYRSIFEQFQDLYYRTDPEGFIQELSPSVKDLSGYDRGELLGEYVGTVYPDPEEREGLLKELSENGEVRGYEIELEKKSGEIAIASVNSHLIKDEDGEVKGIEGTMRDITEKKVAEEALKREKRRYETLFQQNPESVVEVDEDYRIAKVNERFQDVFGYKEEDILGKKLDELVVPDDKIEEAEELNEKAKREGYFDHETVRLTKEGEEVDVSITARPIEYDGKTRHLAVYRDITERKEATEREKFLHSLLRHDIKNKAQAVQGYLQLLMEGEKELSKDSRELVEGALTANKESVNLIRKVRMLLSAQEEEKKPVDIASTIKDAVESNEAMAERVGIDLSLDCPSTECKVEGGSLLEEVFFNIIENSVNHSEGSRINITGEVKDDEVVCSIEDDGKGIPDDKKEIIFEKGYTTDEDRGTGLGLFLVKNLLESYGGEIEVKDSDMGGARFDVRLKKLSQEADI